MDSQPWPPGYLNISASLRYLCTCQGEGPLSGVVDPNREQSFRVRIQPDMYFTDEEEARSHVTSVSDPDSDPEFWLKAYPDPEQDPRL
jgi:hypothetical protein